MSLKRSYNGITAGEVKQFLEEKYLQYNNPSFIASDRELNRFNRFVHRTFNGTDCRSFIIGMRNIYNSYSSMEDVLLDGMQSTGSLRDGLSHLRRCFFYYRMLQDLRNILLK
jgi:hypothetical protein